MFCPKCKSILMPKKVGAKAVGAGLTSDHSGDVPGSTLHADFWNTWDQDVLEFLVVKCLDGGLSCKQLTDAKLAQML